MRRDDGVGPRLARRLAARGLRAREWPGDGAGLIDLFGSEASLVLIDATHIGQTPGTVLRIDARDTPLPQALFCNSTHEFGLAEAVEVARRLGGLPAELVVVGIEGADFGFGEGLSAPVCRAALEVEAGLCRVAARAA